MLTKGAQTLCILPLAASVDYTPRGLWVLVWIGGCGGHHESCMRVPQDSGRAATKKGSGDLQLYGGATAVEEPEYWGSAEVRFRYVLRGLLYQRLLSDERPHISNAKRVSRFAALRFFSAGLFKIRNPSTKPDSRVQLPTPENYDPRSPSARPESLT